MSRIHISTTLAVILNLAAYDCYSTGFVLVASGLAVVAFFAALRDVSRYTSWYQFIMVLVSAVFAGFIIDFPFVAFPFLTIALKLAALACLVRIAFFRFFSYTKYTWVEPALAGLASLVFLIGALLGQYIWPVFLITSPIILFSLFFAWGIIKDKNQLLKNSRGGYRVQTGKPANEFELPDQDGNLVKLSDYRNERHVLLIFVRGDWCPGCHMMLRTYEKNNHKFKSKNILVMAIGPDPVGVNREMVEKLSLDFRVLSDEGQRTAMMYGVQLKDYESMVAEKYEEGIPLPASFLVDKQGIVRYVSRPDKVGEFLNPSLIFPMVELLDGSFSSVENTTKEAAQDSSATIVATKDELKDHAATIVALKKELNNYESIIDQANDAMIVIDIVDGKIHQSNPSASKLLEYPKAELEKISLFDLHPKEYLDRSSRIVADVWEKGGLIYTDIPFVTKSGEIIQVECSAKVAPYAGRPAIVIYARDIRERLRMEAEINEQRKMIDEKNKDIQDSIEYSKRIQRSILLEKEKLRQFAPESFILFKPRDVVSGDFYWFTGFEVPQDVRCEHGHEYKKGSTVLIVAAVDCTGHGVPGAFMSLIGNTLINQALRDFSSGTAATSLDYLDAELKKSLNKNKGDKPLRDGMDIALCWIDMQGRHMEYAGANNPVYIVRNNELIVLNADKQPITASTESPAKPFTNKTFKLQSGDAIYLFTDGYADQFGGQRGKKFMYKQFKEVLVNISERPMETQRTELERIFEEWKGALSQVDDVLVIGIKIP